MAEYIAELSVRRVSSVVIVIHVLSGTFCIFVHIGLVEFNTVAVVEHAFWKRKVMKSLQVSSVMF